MSDSLGVRRMRRLVKWGYPGSRSLPPLSKYGGGHLSYGVGRESVSRRSPEHLFSPLAVDQHLSSQFYFDWFKMNSKWPYWSGCASLLGRSREPSIKPP